MKKVKDYKTYLNNNENEYSSFVLKMIDTMASLGTYVGIDTRDFDSKYFLAKLETYHEAEGKFCFYCCNNDNNILNAIYYIADCNNDIPLLNAMTFHVNLKNGEFVYHNFTNANKHFSVNVIHKKMSGVLPYYIFEPSNADSLTRIIDADFNVKIFSQNTIYEMETVIEESKNEKQYIDNDSFIWELSYSLSELNANLEYYAGDAYHEIINLSLNDAKRYVIDRKDNFAFPSRVIYTLELIDYKKKYDEMRKEKVNSLVKSLNKRANTIFNNCQSHI